MGIRKQLDHAEICTVCAKLKNVCQTCILDLQYGLPTQIRDAVLEEHEKVNLGSDFANRGYAIENFGKLLENNGTDSLPYNKITAAGMLERLARRTPYYKRNENHYCSFFLRGECTRGAFCPYKHEIPLYLQDDPMSHQNIKDRFNGVNDPVAEKLMKKYGPDSTFDAVLELPEDKSITTLWCGGMEDSVTEEDVRNKFYPFGAVSNIRMVYNKGCAYITYVNRKAAELAAKTLHNKIVIRGSKLRLAWGRATDALGPRERMKRPPPGVGNVPAAITTDSALNVSSIAPKVHSNPDANAYLSAPKPTAPVSFVPPPPPGMDSTAYYPSMDARKMQTKLQAKNE